MKQLFVNIRDFLKAHKEILFKFALMLATVATISVITVLILMACGMIYFDEGIQFHTEMFYSFKSSWYGILIFILIQTLLSMLMCIVPGAAMAFTLLSQALYEEPWNAFLLAFASVMISSAVMYVVGYFGGYKLCSLILGKEDCDKSLTLLRNKGTVFFPLMMMFPIFPDNALVMMAGALKMSLKWFIPSIVIGRGIGIATVIFGLSIVPFDKFTSAWHWIGFIIVCAILVILVFLFAIKLNQFMERRRNKIGKDENDTD